MTPYHGWDRQQSYIIAVPATGTPAAEPYTAAALDMPRVETCSDQLAVGSTFGKRPYELESFSEGQNPVETVSQIVNIHSHTLPVADARQASQDPAGGLPPPTPDQSQRKNRVIDTE